MHPLIEQNREKLATLCRQYGVRQLAVFGSILREDFDPARSDVDLVAEFDPPVSGDLVGQYFDLKERLEELFRRKVDLVELKAVRNPLMRHYIETTRVPLYVAQVRRPRPHPDRPYVAPRPLLVQHFERVGAHPKVAAYYKARKKA